MIDPVHEGEEVTLGGGVGDEEEDDHHAEHDAHEGEGDGLQSGFGDEGRVPPATPGVPWKGEEEVAWRR